MKPRLNPKEQVILQTMYRIGIPITAHEIAIKSGLSWATVEKYLKTLQEKKLVNITIQEKKKYWELAEELY